MLKKLTALLGSLGLMMCVFTTNTYAEGFTAGISGMIGRVTTDGNEKEKTSAGDKETTNHDEKEMFYGADLFVEYEFSNGLAFGVSYVPVDAELGSGKRTDTDSSGDSGTDTGDRSASADLEDLTTYYLTKTIGDNGWYGVLGYHSATITTTETLPTSTYGNADINGYQLGFGKKVNDNVRYELSYSDFESISLTSSNDSTQLINADADALVFKVGLSF